MDNNFEEIYKKIISELNAEDIEKSSIINMFIYNIFSCITNAVYYDNFEKNKK